MKAFFKISITALLATTILQSAFASEPKPSFKGVDFKASKELLCTTGQSVKYTNETKDIKLDGEFTSSYIWTFDGGAPNTFLGENPPMITYKSTGTFKTKLLGQASNKKGEVLGKDEKVMLIVVQNPVVNLGTYRSICAGTAITLDAGVGFSKYRWTNGQNNGKLGDESTLVVNTNGTYQMTAETPAGCEATDEVKIALSICTGVENEMANANIGLYPNPTKDIVNVKARFDVASEIKIVIVTSTGVEVSSQAMPSATDVDTSINVSNLNSGLYRVNYYVNGVLAKSMPLMIQ